MSTKTVIVLGPPRSGTSAISGILRIMGVDMGNVNDKNHEDPRFNFKRKSIEEIRKTINDRKMSSSGVWGWKEPTTHYYLKNVLDLIEHPVFIVCVRSVWQSARSRIERNDKPLKVSVAGLYKSISKQYVDIFGLIDELGLPYLAIDNEMLLKYPLENVNTLSEFLEIPTNLDIEERIRNFLKPGSYKKIVV